MNKNRTLLLGCSGVLYVDLAKVAEVSRKWFTLLKNEEHCLERGLVMLQKQLLLEQVSSRSENSRVVPLSSAHKLNYELSEGGISLEHYDKTFKFGKTVVHVVAPPAMSKKEIDRVLDDYHKAGWAIIKEMLMKEKDLETNKVNE